MGDIYFLFGPSLYPQHHTTEAHTHIHTMLRIVATSLLFPFAFCGEPCEDPWVFDGGTRCVLRSTEKGPWGPEVCFRLDANLYAMENAQMQSNMGGFADHFGEFWVGMREMTTREGWVWDDRLTTAVDATMWPATRPDVDSGDKHCAFMGGGLATTAVDCHYDDPLFPALGAPVICEESCLRELPYVCVYKSTSGVACDVTDVDWTFFSQMCFKLFTTPVQRIATNCRGTGGNPKADLAYMFDADEAAAVKELLGDVVGAWVSASKGGVIRTKRWEWLDPLDTYQPKWFANRDSSPLGACAFIAGSEPQMNMTTNCSANTGDLCPALCSQEYRHLCQKLANTLDRPWPPEAYMPPIAPPTPTKTTTPTLTLTGNTPTLSATLTPTVTQTRTITFSETFTITPAITLTEVPIDDEAIGLWWIGVVVAGLCLLCCLTFILWKRARAEEFDWAKMHGLEAMLGKKRSALAADVDSDPSDASSQSSSSHEYVSPYGFSPQSVNPIVRRKDTEEPRESERDAPVYYVHGTHTDPTYLADEPYIADWKPHVVTLAKEFDISRGQALQSLREHGGHFGSACVAMQKQSGNVVNADPEDDRYSV